MPDEVWSLHPNPALLPSARIPAQLRSLLTGSGRRSPSLTQGQMEASLFLPGTSEADRGSVTPTVHPLTDCQLIWQWWCWDAVKKKKKEDNSRLSTVYQSLLFRYTNTQVIALRIKSISSFQNCRWIVFCVCLPKLRVGTGWPKKYMIKILNLPFTILIGLHVLLLLYTLTVMMRKTPLRMRLKHGLLASVRWLWEEFMMIK